MENQSNTSTEETPDPVIAALNILIKAAIIGQKNGAYTLNEAGTILESIKVIQEKLKIDSMEVSIKYIGRQEPIVV